MVKEPKQETGQLATVSVVASTPGLEGQREAVVFAGRGPGYHGGEVPGRDSAKQTRGC